VDKKWISILMVALEHSVKLQSHYAGLLNAYDGGARREFPHPTDWIERLMETGDIPRSEIREAFAELIREARRAS
jgi:hypothetical protein